MINTATDKVEQTIVLNPLSPAQVGFKSNGSTLDRIPQRKDGSGNEIFDFDTGCFPNLLGSAGIKNGRAYVPAVGSSPNGPFRFNVNLQSVLSVVNLAAGSEETGKTINMNKGIGAEKVGTKLFLSNPAAIAFKQSAGPGPDLHDPRSERRLPRPRQESARHRHQFQRYARLCGLPALPRYRGPRPAAEHSPGECCDRRRARSEQLCRGRAAGQAVVQ